MPPIATTSELVSTPLSNQIREALQQAADIVGTTLNQFMVQASLEKAQSIIENEKIIRLSQADAEVFFNALDNPPLPNDKLREAVAAYKESPLYDSNRNAWFREWSGADFPKQQNRNLIASNSIVEMTCSTNTCNRPLGNMPKKV